MSVVHYEQQKLCDLIKGDQYRLQLIRSSHVWGEERSEYDQRHDKTILLHDNARANVAEIVKKW